MSDPTHVSIPEWTEFGLTGGAVFIPDNFETMTEDQRQQAGFPRTGGALKRGFSFRPFNCGKRDTPVRRGAFLSHPFLKAVEISECGGVRFHGRPIGPNRARAVMVGEPLIRFDPERLRFRDDLSHASDFHLRQREQDLGMRILPLQVLVTETHSPENAPRPDHGGEDVPDRREIGEWMDDALRSPMESPESWPIDLRLAVWVITLRGRAWNAWRDSVDEQSTT
jgi:hypothetical protein